MWICCNHLRAISGGGYALRKKHKRSSTSYLIISTLLLCCYCCICPTAADTSSSSTQSATDAVGLQPSTTQTVECKNASGGAAGSDGESRLSVINQQGSSEPNLPLVPPAFLNGALTCQPYHRVGGVGEDGDSILVNHLYFQLANGFFLLAHLAPASGLRGLLYLRFTLLVGCAFLALWAWTVVCWLDAALWNALFIVIGFIHVCVLLYRLRPVRFSKEIEEVYVAVFQPLRVSRQQFKKVLGCMKTIRQLKYQEVYAQEKVTKVDSLSLVLSGKLVVSQNGKALHIVFPHQFLDSPEWFGVSTDEFFQVSITAMEESRVLLWHRDKLKLSIITDQFLQAVFDHILGRDVVKKLMQVSETMAASAHQQQNGQVIGLGGMNNQDHDLDAKMFVVKKANDSQGITALISRQLQAAGDPNAWRLGRIEETDHETPV